MSFAIIYKMSLEKEEKMDKISWKKCTAALFGIFLVSVGVAFNAQAGLGNDPVGIFYDGIRSSLGLTAEQLGVASNLVNLSLIVLLFVIGRRYINVGTIIYILPYGTFVNAGTYLYRNIFAADGLAWRVMASFIGCLFICFGVAIFILMDIGLDPMTGLAMVLRDRLHIEYRKAKVLFDITVMAVGFFLGGKLGIVTIVTALCVGPTIQWMCGRLQWWMDKRWVKI